MTMLDWGMSPPDEPFTARFLLIADLFETGLVFKRCQIRSREPGLSDDEVERRLEAWLLRADGAEHGDAEGRVVPWPRR